MPQPHTPFRTLRESRVPANLLSQTEFHSVLLNFHARSHVWTLHMLFPCLELLCLVFVLLYLHLVSSYISLPPS